MTILRIWLLCWLIPSVVGQDPFARVGLDAAEIAQATAGLGMDPAAAFRTIAGADAAQRRAVGSALRELDSALQVRIARDALWSDDPQVALGASLSMSAWWLDACEAERVIALQGPNLLQIDSQIDPVDFEGLLGTDDFEAMIADPAPLPRSVSDYVGALHRASSDVHIPALARLTVSDDSLARQGAIEVLRLVAMRSDRFRESVATALLGWRGGVPFRRFRFDPRAERDPVTPREFRLPESTGGFSPLLTLTLRRVLVTPADEFVKPFDAWVVRWALAERAGDADLDLVSALAGRESRSARIVGARAAADLGARAVLDVLFDDADATVAALATAGLAQAGDAAALERLHDDGRPEFSAARIEVEPAAARDAWLARLSAVDGEGAVEAFAAAVRSAQHEGFRVEPDWIVDCVDRLAATGLSEAVCAALAERLPESHTAALATAWFERLGVESLASPGLGFLEVADAQSLRARLRRIAAAEDQVACDAALAVLLKLGDEPSGTALVEFTRRCDRDEADSSTLDTGPWILLGRTPGPAVVDYLVEAIEAEPAGYRAIQCLAALEQLRGVAERVASGFASDLVSADQERVLATWSAMTAGLRTASAGDSICAWLAARPLRDGGFAGLGSLDRPEAAEYLRRAASEREHGLVRWATGELALRGDAAASAQLDRVLARAWQGWLDTADPFVLTGGGDLASAPYWIARVATNCCAEVTAVRVLESLIGDRPELFEDSTARSAHALTRDFFARWGARLEPSRIAGHRVVGPQR